LCYFVEKSQQMPACWRRDVWCWSWGGAWLGCPAENNRSKKEPFRRFYRVTNLMNKFIALFQRRGADDFEQLMAPHVERLFRLAYRFCGEVQAAEDLLQDLLLKLYPRYRELQRIDQLGPWLARSLYNHFVDTRRREQRTPFYDAVDDGVLVSVAATGFGPEQESEQGDLQQQLLQAMERLGPEQRALVSMHDIEGYTLQELEGILDTPIGTLKSRLHRSRKLLREQVQREPFSSLERVNSQRTGK